MKKIIVIFLLLSMCFSLVACNDCNKDEVPSINDDASTPPIIDNSINDNTTETESTSIILTDENFFDYFTIQYEFQNLRIESSHNSIDQQYYSVCDLVVQIYLIESKSLSKVSFTLDIVQHSTSKYKGNSINKEIVMPASGSYSFTKTIKSETMRTVHVGTIVGTLNPIEPSASDFLCSITKAKGTLC